MLDTVHVQWGARLIGLGGTSVQEIKKTGFRRRPDEIFSIK